MTFIQSVTNTLIRDGWDRLQNYTLVFPMQRAGLYFKQQIGQLLLQQNHSKPVVLPRMLTIDQLVDDLSPLSLIDEVRAVCQLYRIYIQHPTPDREDISLDAFYGWGRQMLQDFSNIDMSLLDTRQVIRHVSDAGLLDELNLDSEDAQALLRLVNLDGFNNERIRRFFHALWTCMPDIYDAFSEQQAADGLGTKGACYKYVVSHFEELLPQLEGRTMVFVGFNYLLPAERQLMHLFQSHNQALFFWDYDPNFHTDPSVYKFILDNIQQFGNALPTEQSLFSTSSPKPITIISAMSANAQAQYVAEWIQQHHHEGERTAVVITDESILESVLYALPSDLSNRVNITKGYPLRSTNIYANIVSYLSDSKHDKLPGEDSFLGVIQRLSDSLVCPSMPADAQSATWQEILQVEAYCQTQQVLNRMQVLIREGVLNDVRELHSLRNILCRLLDSVTLPFHGEPVEEIQVIGVLETRLLDFDNLLILNVEEGVVPGSGADHSFIPFDIRKFYHMSTHDEDSKVYAYNFFRLIRRSRHVTLIFSETVADVSKKAMSRFIMQIILSPDFQVQKVRLNERADTPDAVDLVPSRSWLSVARNGELRLSPSSLADYIECPRKFYLRHIERIEPSEGTTLIFALNELGTIFHGAIKYAYECIGHIPSHLSLAAGSVTDFPIASAAILDFISDEHWHDHADAALKAGYQELISDYNRHHELQDGEERYCIDNHKAENEVVCTMLRNVLRYDAEHLTDLRIRLLEVENRIALPFDVEGSDGRLQKVVVRMGGTIDRLDLITENGRQYLRVLDYKTGSYNAEKMKAKTIEDLFTDSGKHYALQTLLYSSVCNNATLNPSGLPIMPQLMFVQRLSADMHVYLNGMPITDYSVHQQEFMQNLRQTIASILSEHTQPDPWPKTSEKECVASYCPFHLLCSREQKTH